ncbi:hypothetical protein PV08_10548 [Exophiala spinifera]|uniref:Clr5 domain-containing protein n=1 Tax=Exophiala spinifera TaxID=91928 RepID=A0A0D2AX14_9EURO|nr:uncharacterized protein PV08_10548 [Exophiala spinifera]KIW11248.1 hypothetical protein PV08_10548 [Exophiala spinifera]
MPIPSQVDIFEPQPPDEQLSTTSSVPGHQRHDWNFQHHPDGSYAEVPPRGIPSKKRKRKVPTLQPDKWEPYKARILELHVNNGLPLSEVQRLIEAETGFGANLRQYRTRISQWGYDKNVKPNEMSAIVRKQQHRSLNEPGKAPLRFKIRGNVVEKPKVDRWMQRHGVPQDSLYAPSPEAATPSALSCWTMSESGSPAPSPSSFPGSVPPTQLPSPTDMAPVHHQIPLGPFSTEVINPSRNSFMSQRPPQLLENYKTSTDMSCSVGKWTNQVEAQDGLLTRIHSEQSGLQTSPGITSGVLYKGVRADWTVQRSSPTDNGNWTMDGISDERNDSPTTTDGSETECSNLRPQPPASSARSASALEFVVRAHLYPTPGEDLLCRFDDQICSITCHRERPPEISASLLWSSALRWPALFRGIAAISEFNDSREGTHLRSFAFSQLKLSIHMLFSKVDDMHLEAALATSLVMAQCDGWCGCPGMCSEHIDLPGRRRWPNTAMNMQKQRVREGARGPRPLEFCCSSHVYLDVIRSLIPFRVGKVGYTEILPVNQSDRARFAVDPLMGCTATLFPLISATAALVQLVECRHRYAWPFPGRRPYGNSSSIISLAQDLKNQLEEWSVPFAPDVFQHPEDSDCRIYHSIQMAEAARHATLLNLHQAVPEVPGEPSMVMAGEVLGRLLDAMPESIRTSFREIFPLLAAGALIDAEDIEWLSKRASNHHIAT